MARTRKAPAKKETAKKVSELDSIMGQVNKAMGTGTMRPSSLMRKFTHIETGIFMFDFALLGGLPEGLASMIYGIESSGKSTVAIRIIAHKLQKYPDKKAIWVDSEQTFDTEWARKHGVDTDRLIVSEPESGEQAIDIIDAVMYAEDVCAIVLDSIPATVPQKISSNSAEDATVGLLAQLMGKMCSKILTSWKKERKRNHYVDVILINQFREKIGVMFGDTRSTPGGKQPNYLCTTKIEMKNKEIMGKDGYDNEVVDYNQHTFKITKSKIGNSVKTGEFRLILNSDHDLGLGAIDEAGTVVTYAKKMGFLTGGGKSQKLYGVAEPFPKQDAIKDYLNDNPDEMLRMKQILIAAQREEKGLPPIPHDGWLLGPVDDSLFSEAMDETEYEEEEEEGEE